MQGRDLAAAGAGMLIGAAVVGALWAAGRPGPASQDPQSADTTTTTQAHWFSPLEERIGPSAVVPTALEVTAGSLLVTYDVRNILDTAEGSPGTAAAAPARWTLVGPDFEVTEEAVAPSSRGVRFAVPAGFEPDAATVLRLDAYWSAAAVEIPLSIDRSGAAWYPIGPGLQARLVEVIAQADNTIVIVEVDGPQSLTEQMTIDGLGREWVSSSRSMLGSHRWTLDYRGADLPDPLPLVARGIQWLEIDSALEFGLGPILP